PVATGAFRLQFDNAEEVELVRESIAFFDELQTGVDLGLKHQGYLFVSRTAAGARTQGELVDAQRQWGLTDIELLDGTEARRRFPYLAGDVINARFRQGDGWLEPRRLALELARSSGATFQTGVGVTDFIREGDRVLGVSTTAGPIESGTVVIAAGPLSGPIAPQAGQYTYTPDRRPLLGPTVVPGLAVNTGYSGHGIMGSIGGSRRAVDAITGALSPGANPFRPDRPMEARSFDVL